MVFVLQTIIILMTVFPANETRQILQKAKVFPNLSAVGLLEQLDGSMPFMVVFVFFILSLAHKLFFLGWQRHSIHILEKTG